MSTNPVTLAELDWTFGDRLRKIRKVVGVSQADFAAELSQGRQSVAAWELGTNEPRNPVAVAKRIELAYGVPASWTLGLSHQGPNGGPAARWGDRLRGAMSEVGGLKPVVEAVRQVLGSGIGTEAAFAKLFAATGWSELDGTERFRAWLLIACAGADAASFGVNDEAVPRHFDVERLRLELYTTRDSNPEPADLGPEDELAARRTARSAVEVEQVAA